MENKMLKNFEVQDALLLPLSIRMDNKKPNKEENYQMHVVFSFFPFFGIFLYNLCFFFFYMLVAG
jgi:hypothetical protein